MKHLIESLPKSIKRDDGIYFLEMHITAFDKLCLCYRKLGPSKEYKYILSIVVKTENSSIDFDDINSITDAKDFNWAVELLSKRVFYAISKDLIRIYL